LAVQAQTQSNSGSPAQPKPLVSFDINAMDKSVDPCTDFYQYACGNWIKDNPIPADQPEWGRFNELHEHNQSRQGQAGFVNAKCAAISIPALISGEAGHAQMPPAVRQLSRCLTMRHHHSARQFRRRPASE
jgi:predicted metalloendopeptidase